MDRCLKDEALAEFESGDYSSLARQLTLPPSASSPHPTYNTLFCKGLEKADSFDLFSSLRPAAAQNLYLHVPVCRTACLYCSYEKVLNPSPELLAAYLRTLDKEIDRKKSIHKNGLKPDIFYIGGGTPTALPEEDLRHLLQLLAREFELEGNLEFTVETTPEAVLRPDGMAKLSLLREMHVNRINVGVQSFSTSVALQNGRHQSKEQVVHCFERLRSIGFSKVNLDLVYGLPGQTLDLWEEDLKAAAALNPDSLTTFALRVRPPSALHTQALNGRLELPPENARLVMRIMAQRHLAHHGYAEDIPDYFITGPEKKYLYQPFQPHNRSRNLIGCGPSAYSLAGNTQVFNVRDTREYIRRSAEGGDPIEGAIRLNGEEFARKRFAEGLKTVFADDGLREECGLSIFALLPRMVAKLEELGLISINQDEIILSHRGRALHDQVCDYIKYDPDPQ